MPKTEQFQTNFAAGEIDPDLYARQDTEQYQNGAKSLHNRRVLTSGGTVRRPATWRDTANPATCRIRQWVVNRATQYVMAFSAGRVDFYSIDPTTKVLTAAGNLTGCPWTGSLWQRVCVAQSANTTFVTAATMKPQVLTRTGASSWSRQDFAFVTGAAGRPEQPYYKFAPAAVTLTPSGVSGSITLNTSAAWFTANHVNCYIRYMKKAMQITAFTNSTTVTATVIERLPATYEMTVGSTTNFAVGEIVTGTVTGAKGQVTSIPNGTTIRVVLTEKLIAFTTADKLVGPQADTTISGVSTTTSAAVETWDEQMFSPVFGYPAVCALHRNRLIFAGHESAGNVLIASVIDNLYNFNTGTGGDSDAILESIGDAAAADILHVYSAEQLLVATDTGLYYVPESAQQPFRPSSMAFFPFGSKYTISPYVTPVPFDGGVVFCAENLVLIARPTGDFNQQWSVDEVSLLSQHLFKTPTDMTVVGSYAGGSERYVLIVNADGTLAVMQVIQAQKTRNVVPWETDFASHTFKSVCGVDGTIYAHTERLINGVTTQLIERFSQSITLDCAAQVADLNTATIEAIYGAGNTTALNVVTTSGFHLGTWPVTLEEIPAGPYIVGFKYDSEIETLPPVIEGSEGSRAGEYMRIVDAQVIVQSSARFAANGYELEAYQVTDDPTLPPPAKSGPQEFQFLDWIVEPTIKITQPDPLPLKVLGIKTTVAF